MKPFEDISVDCLLPQQPPFRFVDRLLYCDEQRAEVEFTVPAAGIFVSEGSFQPGGIVEHMAQACSAMTGYIAVYIRHIPVSVGYLGHVRSLQLHRLPSVGERLYARVQVIELVPDGEPDEKIEKNRAAMDAYEAEYGALVLNEGDAERKAEIELEYAALKAETETLEGEYYGDVKKVIDDAYGALEKGLSF